jgi:hypothetical protein
MVAYGLFQHVCICVADPDMGMHQSEKTNPDLHPSQKSRIQILIHTCLISGALEVHNGAIEGPPENFKR